MTPVTFGWGSYALTLGFNFSLLDDVYTVTLNGSTPGYIADAAGNALHGNQSGGNDVRTFTIDTAAPVVSSVTPNLTMVADANVGTATFSVTVVYNEPMDQRMAPTLTFTPDVAGTLSLNAASGWTNSTTYVAWYDVADGNVAVPNVGIGVTLAQDLAGNVQTPYSGTNNFNIDTHNPTVTFVNASETTVADATAAATQPAFSVTVFYSEAMKDSVAPTLIFTPNVAGTLTQSAAWWITNGIFYAQYDVTDGNVAVPNIGIGVTGAQIANGNVQVPYSGTNNFNVDTQNPTVISYSLEPDTGITGDQITRVTTPTLTYKFSEPISGSAGDVAVSGATHGAVTPDIVWGTHTLILSFATPLVDDVYTVTLNGSTQGYIADAAGNALHGNQSGGNDVRTFTIDTAGPVVSSVTPNLTMVADANVGTATFTVTVVYNEPMDQTMAPTLTFTPDVAGTLALERQQRVEQQYDLRRGVRRGRRQCECPERRHRGHVGPGCRRQRPDALQRHQQLRHRHAQPDRHVRHAERDDGGRRHRGGGAAGVLGDGSLQRADGPEDGPDAHLHARRGRHAEPECRKRLDQQHDLCGLVRRGGRQRGGAERGHRGHVGPGCRRQRPSPVQRHQQLQRRHAEPDGHQLLGLAGHRHRRQPDHRDPPPEVRYFFSEAISGSAGNVAVSGATHGAVTPATFGWGTHTLTLSFTTPLVDDVYTVTLNGSTPGYIADAAGNALHGNQSGGNNVRTFTIDTAAPVVSSVTPNLTMVADANVGTATFSVTVVYNEPMDQTMAPTLTFTPGVAGTLTLSASSAWSNSTTYVAVYDVADANVNVPSVGIGVTLARDVAGNVQTPYSGTNNFNVDTHNPTVTSVTPSVTTVADATAGTGTFSVTVVYSEAMKHSVAPTLTFTPDVASTLTLSASSAWSNSTTYVAVYDVADANMAVPNVGIGVTGAQIANGNVQVPYSGTNNFNIDTHNPTVTSVTPNLALLSDATAAAVQPAFSVTVVYSEAMNTLVIPSVTFTPAAASSLSLNAASGWTNNTTYVAWYDVADANVAVPNVGIGVTGARSPTATSRCLTAAPTTSTSTRTTRRSPASRRA